MKHKKYCIYLFTPSFVSLSCVVALQALVKRTATINIHLLPHLMPNFCGRNLQKRVI